MRLRAELAADTEHNRHVMSQTSSERKFEANGVTTILQLSYGYRARRHTRKKVTSNHDRLLFKHDHRLKALAIKKGQIHVVGSPSLSIGGTPVFIDVEGDPDRNFYYLIGLRYERPGGYVQKFFWANRSEDECNIWRAFLDALKELDSPKLVSYGAYEIRFLRKMTGSSPKGVGKSEFGAG